MLPRASARCSRQAASRQAASHQAASRQAASRQAASPQAVRGRSERRGECAGGPAVYTVRMGDTLVQVRVARSLSTSALTRVPWVEALSDAEQDRAARFRVNSARADYISTRLLLRTALSDRLEQPPGTFRIVIGRHGKPSLEAEGPVVEFSLSHSCGWCACATASVPVGLDIECTSREIDIEAIAGRFYTHDEKRQLRGLSGSDRRMRCFELWTLKEAYAKALGLGFGAKGAALSITRQSNRIRACGIGGQVLEQWHFELIHLAQARLLAVALERADAAVQVQHVDLGVELGRHAVA